MVDAVKNDTGKRRLGLIPPDALDAIADVLTFGAKKYADWNWTHGFKWSRLYDAAQRHLNSWNAGEDNDMGDGGSGLPHLAHALCCLAFLLVHQKRKLGTDDRHRWPAVKSATADERERPDLYSAEGGPLYLAKRVRETSRAKRLEALRMIDRLWVKCLNGKITASEALADSEFRDAVVDAIGVLHPDPPEIEAETADPFLLNLQRVEAERDTANADCAHALTLADSARKTLEGVTIERDNAFRACETFVKSLEAESKLHARASMSLDDARTQIHALETALCTRTRERDALASDANASKV